MRPICRCPSPGWKVKLPAGSDEYVYTHLERAWANKEQINRQKKSRIYHDWAHYRAITLREARKRGLDLSAAGR